MIWYINVQIEITEDTIERIYLEFGRVRPTDGNGDAYADHKQLPGANDWLGNRMRCVCFARSDFRNGTSDHQRGDRFRPIQVGMRDPALIQFLLIITEQFLLDFYWILYWTIAKADTRSLKFNNLRIVVNDYVDDIDNRPNKMKNFTIQWMFLELY